MKPKKDFLTREEALATLGVKTATLYTYVSRGLIRSTPAEGTNRHLYAREDVERFAARGRGRLPRAVTAATSMRWGEPVVMSSITSIEERGPVYRNRPAIDLAMGGHAFEVVAHFLVTGNWQEAEADWPAVDMPADVATLLHAHSRTMTPADIGHFMAMLAIALSTRGRDQHEIAHGAAMPALRTMLETFAGCFGYLSPEGSHAARNPGERLAAHALRASGAALTPQAVAAVDATLVVLADHELAPATFAARVAASSDASLYNCIASAIGAHVGYATGAGTARVETQLFETCTESALEAKLELVRNHGVALFGFNHPLYPHGDPRAALILSLAARCGADRPDVANMLRFVERVRAEADMTPGLALALVTLARALDMPRGSAAALWILARTAGWGAHVVEQRAQAFMLRPRARYIPAPLADD
ncbi:MULTISPECIES: citrate synthase [Burkholderiaceae]|uniref:citrate synthase n=1 Tax=Burkholderiaceae TaxID=119060 RepID=UPI001F049922|nr:MULTISPECIES: citrate synthase [Burkholderiaceae]